MPNRKIKHIVAKLVGASTEETLDVYDVDAVHTDKIYNGLDQTTAGYVLDARQGKALNDSLSALSDSITINVQNVTLLRYNNENRIDMKFSISSSEYYSLVATPSNFIFQHVVNGSTTNLWIK